MNTLYYGDNLKILREYIPDESVDLIYLDPPFNSNRNYNVLFKDESGTHSDAQITAFEDTWHWHTGNTAETYHELILAGDKVAEMIEAFHGFIGSNQMMAYLVMMAIRLKELHRVLKPTGSIYLHCDPVASHYLKIVLDAIFGAERFKTEIVWKRTTAHSYVYSSYGDITDTIFFYTKTASYSWNQLYRSQSQEDLVKAFPMVDPDGRRWRSENLRNPGVRPNLHYPYTASNGITYLPHPNGWTVSLVKMKELDRQGRLHFPKKAGGRLRLKYYADESSGIKLQNLWDDVSPIGAQAQERLGYPTQKPVALLERIISASSNEGDVVLDPFCGCGTTIAAAQKLNRRWIGIDITHLSVGLMKLRLKDSFGLVPTGGQASLLARVRKDSDGLADNTTAKMPNAATPEEPALASKMLALQSYQVIGQPEDIEGARELAANDRYGFQWWILPLIGAKAYGAEAGKKEGKKGADKGIDGSIVFVDDNSNKAKRVIVSVKSGHPNVSHIRDLGHVIDRENAAIGVYVTLEPPTKPMITEAVEKGFYHSPGWNRDYPRLQILTVEEILSGKQVDMPPTGITFKQAGKIADVGSSQRNLIFE